MLKRFLSTIITIIGTLFILAGTVFAVEVKTADVKTTGPHWQKSQITVYVPENSKYTNTVKQAFNTWQTKTMGKLSFRYVPKSPADIEVIFCEDINSPESPIASYNIKIEGQNEITKGELQLATKGKTITKYSNTYVYTTLLHETGHILGLTHNSRKPSSIRYPEIHEGQTILKLDVMDLYYTYGWSWMDRRINK